MRIFLCLCLAVSAFGQKATSGESVADSDWNKVMALPKGTEVRVAAKGIKGVLEGKVDLVNDEAIVVILPKEQRSVLREDIDRLDFRNADKTKRTTKTERYSNDDTSANPIPPGQRLPGQSAVPRNMSSGTTVMLPSKAPWEPYYVRPKTKEAK
ncbi:MAG: hypothetical protein OHK0021_15470 [Bryobacter sp.]